MEGGCNRGREGEREVVMEGEGGREGGSDGGGGRV